MCRKIEDNWITGKNRWQRKNILKFWFTLIFITFFFIFVLLVLLVFWIDDFSLGYEDNFILIFDWVLNKITCFYLWAFLPEKKVTCLGFLKLLYWNSVNMWGVSWFYYRIVYFVLIEKRLWVLLIKERLDR